MNIKKISIATASVFFSQAILAGFSGITSLDSNSNSNVTILILLSAVLFVSIVKWRKSKK